MDLIELQEIVIEALWEDIPALIVVRQLSLHWMTATKTVLQREDIQERWVTVVARFCRQFNTSKARLQNLLQVCKEFQVKESLLLKNKESRLLAAFVDTDDFELLQDFTLRYPSVCNCEQKFEIIIHACAPIY